MGYSNVVIITGYIPAKSNINDVIAQGEDPRPSNYILKEVQEHGL